MSRESPSTWHPDVVNRFVFRDVADTARYGVNTDINIVNGVAVFNGTTSKLEFTAKHTGIYSLRFKINKLNSLTQDICKLSSAITISINSGVITTTGITTPLIFIDGKLNSTITAEGGDVFIVSKTPFTINNFILGYSTGYFSGEIDLIEFYNDALVEGMCDAIYTGRYFTQHPADMMLIKEMKRKGYIWVPGNGLYEGCENGFWVAKYQMKASKTGVNGKGLDVTNFPGMTSTYNTWYFSEDSNITLVSTPEGSPITNIKQTEAITLCSGLTNNFRKLPGMKMANAHLITNNEWMTLARNIELVPSNWSGGVVGDGYLPRGNSSSSSAMDGFDELSGWTKRTLTLTNGEVIWDLAGNVWEWTNDSILQKDQPDGFNDVDDSSYTGGQWFDYSKGGGVGRYITSDNLGDTTLEYKDLFLLTSNKYNADNNGVGRIYTYSNNTSTSPRVFLRGGSWHYGSNSGLLSLFLIYVSGYLYRSFGLRCAVVP